MKSNEKSFGELVYLSDNQLNPRNAKPEDFGPVPAKDNGQSEPKLEDLTENQFAPRHAEDGGKGSSGAGTPSNDRSASVAKNFKSSQNNSEAGDKVSSDNWVDFKDGQHSCAYGVKK
jgi:hypothetical protein